MKVRLYLWPIPFFQLCLLGALWTATNTNLRDQEWTIEKIVTVVCICFLYCMRLFMEKELDAQKEEIRANSQLESYVLFDTFMHCVFEPLVLAFNLSVVLTSPSVLDMVLNALAIEFVQKLDDDAKSKYLEWFRLQTSEFEQFHEPRNVFNKFAELHEKQTQDVKLRCLCRIIVFFPPPFVFFLATASFVWRSWLAGVPSVHDAPTQGNNTAP
eukprot:CAMPEP_0196749730 /NCGR_PEP_ID=MMETSP1091-20130531/78055_1 /TAXON_ID=302021 /ORGANISM="Rhodomonas sp., Strain CCMP768" /LENGTH=212 /DNA_ID=CAMNT_0042097257 /DNA_START=126 /DNA_END=764 /DNA_ORIENTATION=+